MKILLIIILICSLFITTELQNPNDSRIGSIILKWYISGRSGVDVLGCGKTPQTACKTFNFTMTYLFLDYRVQYENYGNITNFIFNPNLQRIEERVYIENAVYRESFNINLINVTMTFIGQSKRGTIIDLTGTGRFLEGYVTKLRISNCTFINGYQWNLSSLVDGGVLFLFYSNVTIFNCRFYNNSVSSQGGVISSFNSEMYIYNSQFIENTSQMGGAMSLTISRVTIVNCKFVSNYVSFEGKGGAIQIFLSRVYIFDSKFLYNMAPYSGAIDFIGGYLLVNCSMFYENLSNTGGAFGAYFISQSKFYSCLFLKNRAMNTGGFAFLSSQSLSIFEQCIFQGNTAPNSGLVETHSTAPIIFQSCLIEGDVDTAVQISLYDNYCHLTIHNSEITNIRGVFIYVDANSVVILEESSFSNMQFRTIDVGNKAEIILLSCVFANIATNDFIFYLSNGKLLAFDLDFYNLTALGFFRTTNEGFIVYVDGTMDNNTVSNSLFSAESRYSIYIQNSNFYNNHGTSKGCIMETDDSGYEEVVNSIFINNTSHYGTIVYYNTPNNGPSQPVESNFQNNTFINNHADFAGALAYFSLNISQPNITCTNCTYINNTATFGEILNSAYYQFNVSMKKQIYPYEQLTITVFASDYFGNLIRGSSDLGFFIIPCPDAIVQGTFFSVLEVNGSSVFTDIRLSTKPGTTCSLTFISVPIPSINGPVTVTVEMVECGDNKELVVLQSVTYCLKKVEPSTIVKVVIGIIAILVALAVIASGCLTIKYRKRRVIRYSNPLFLMIILAGCLISLSVIPTSFNHTNASCKASIPLLFMSLSLISCATFVKQFRIWRLVKDIQLLRETNVENPYLLKFIALLLVIPALVSILSVVVVNQHASTQYDLTKLTLTEYCDFNTYIVFSIIFLVYQVGILAFGCLLVLVCRKFRSVPGTFNEATYIGILLYNYTLIIIITIPLSYIFHKNPLANFLILSISILCYVISTLVLLFLPKFIFLVRKKKVISSLEKLIREQETIVQRNKDILQFYDTYLVNNERPNIESNSNNLATGGRSTKSSVRNRKKSLTNTNTNNGNINNRSQSLPISPPNGNLTPQSEQSENNKTSKKRSKSLKSSPKTSTLTQRTKSLPTSPLSTVSPKKNKTQFSKIDSEDVDMSIPINNNTEPQNNIQENEDDDDSPDFNSHLHVKK
ncbi:G-protein-coupled receptor family 3 protein 15 [Tieghemostelium lacteum]|uniref:G-protein-coupled receptor family 3 protein 15 n=1 Tax=Tieghemostelium lacteum TaxID=361077 RepID=A0A151ZKG9_TIELA|nr:G-protein-coupled receptor family 3 protein 15 [Tieghemostelium lacteum]|eukprot:KYQ94314.1 G-protein-coupled receptor family 3 protein 15 [Tieghemostelium lacteum]